jgi:hypothetical protein
MNRKPFQPVHRGGSIRTQPLRQWLVEPEREIPARSLIEEMRAVARGWYVTSVLGEVSDADIRGYLRAASQIEDV